MRVVLCAIFLATPLYGFAETQVEITPQSESESNPFFPEGLTDEEYERIYQEKMLPVMEQLMESINEVLDDPMNQPLMEVLGTKLYLSDLHEESVEGHWDNIITPLLQQYVADNNVTVEVSEEEAAPSAKKLLNDIKVQLADEIADYEARMLDESLTTEELREVTTKLDLLLETQAAMADVEAAVTGQEFLFDLGIVTAVETKAKHEKALMLLADTHGGEVIETAHGALSPAAVRIWVEAQEASGNVVFLQESYQQKFYAYIDSLLEVESK